jgi:multiple sugar transport system substrate-binding protein
MRKLSALLIVALLLVSSIAPAMAQDAVTLTWYVGLGTGAAPEQRALQEEVVAAWNEANPDIQVDLVIVDNNVAVETLATLIATGEAPDIVGPVGTSGTAAFAGNFLDIEPYLAELGYDAYAEFPAESVDFYRTNEGLVGLPLASFPAFLFYRPEMFDEAGLEYPPAEIGAPYMLDGEEVEWNVDTMSAVAQILTVDENGYDATEDEFDPSNIIQFGFANQWAGAGAMRQNATMHGAGSVIDADGNAVFPDSWRVAFQWFHDAQWDTHIMPNAAQEGSDLLGAGNPFASGNLAMAQSHLWYTCCLEDSEWDAAALPSYEGVVTSRLHADTFRLFNSTENPLEAVEFLTYLVGEASLDLLGVYGGMPARPEDQQAFFDGLDEKYPQGVNWEVVKDSLNYPDIPSHEEALPNNNKANDRLDSFLSLLRSEPDVDVQAEIDSLLVDLQAIFDEAS